MKEKKEEKIYLVTIETDHTYIINQTFSDKQEAKDYMADFKSDYKENNALHRIINMELKELDKLTGKLARRAKRHIQIQKTFFNLK